MIGRLFWRAFGLVLAAIALCVAIAVVRVGPIDVRGLARHEPGRSAVMLEREREARAQGLPYHESRHWVPLEHVAATLHRRGGRTAGH